MARMTVEQLIERVLFKVEDGNFSEDDVLLSLDQCALDIATNCDIKQLATVSELTVVGGTNTIALPSDFCKELTYGYNKTSNHPVKVYDSRVLLDKAISTIGTKGNIRHIADDNPDLYCQYTPTNDQVLDIYYHKNPDDLALDGQFPMWVPSNYIYKLFYHYSVAQLFDIIEDGIEGEKVNTLYHEDRYQEELKKFKLYNGDHPDAPFVPHHNQNFDFTDW